MDKVEVIQTLSYFGAAWPNATVTRETVEVWSDECEDISAAHADEAMHRIVRHDQFFPSIARFREECIAVANRARLENADERGLPESTGEPEWPAELVAEMRGMLKRAPGKARQRSTGGQG